MLPTVQVNKKNPSATKNPAESSCDILGAMCMFHIKLCWIWFYCAAKGKAELKQNILLGRKIHIYSNYNSNLLNGNIQKYKQI